MQLFNKYNSLRAFGISILVITVLVLFSCEVTFHDPLREYIKAVESGTWFSINESDSEYYDDGGACDFGITDNLIKTFTITNLANITLDIYSISSTNNTVFNVNTAGTSFSLDEGKTTTFTVEYDNSGDTSRVSEIIRLVTSSLQGSDFDLNVFAGGENINLAISPDSGYRLTGHGYNYGYQTTTANQVLSFTNNEVFDVEIVSSTILSGDFISSDMGAVTIAVGASGTHSTSYNPTVTENSSQKANLVLTDEMGRTYTVLLRGTNLEQPDHSSLVTDLALWLDAENIRAEDTSIERVNTFISNLPDMSGRSLDLAAKSSSSPIDRRPLYIENGINSHPVLRFDGADDYMMVEPGTDQFIYYDEDESTLFIVFTQGTTNNRYLLSGPYAPNSYYSWPRCYLYYNAGGRFGVYGYNDWYYSISSTWTSGSSYLWTMEKDLAAADMLKVWINLVEPAEVSDDVVYTVLDRNRRLDKLVVGANYNFLTNFQGDLAEIILYNRKLTAPETAWVNAYLNDKYALW